MDLDLKTKNNEIKLKKINMRKHHLYIIVSINQKNKFETDSKNRSETYQTDHQMLHRQVLLLCFLDIHVNT